MKIIKILAVIVCFASTSCFNNVAQKAEDRSKATITKNNQSVKVTGAMRDVMWNGALESKIKIDTITSKEGLYGIGPLAYLKGEILILDGQTYVSRVAADGTATTSIEKNASAPFFVHGHQNSWEESILPVTATDISSLEKHIEQKMSHLDKPFAFKVKGTAANANYHIQNLPEGSKVSSPQEAHIGQENYTVVNEDLIIVGFYSRTHKGIFTHHDTNMHLHMITSDKQHMGHLDSISFTSDKVQLYLPKNISN